VVEAVFIVPLAMLVATVIPLQVMFGWFAQLASESAARQGVESARRYYGTDAQGAARSRQYLHSIAGTFVSDSQVTVQHRTTTSVTVRVQVRVVNLVPGFRWHVDASAAGPIERFSSAGTP
jgi:hypothetical protein